MSLHSWLKIIPLSKLERKRQMELNPTTLEFSNTDKIICKINKINVTILKIRCDLTINNSKLLIALFKWSLTDFRGYMSTDLKHLKSKTDKPQSQGYENSVWSPWPDTTNGMTEFTALQDNSLRLHPLALIYHSSTVPICGICLVWGHGLFDVPISAGWQQVPPSPSAGTDSFLLTFSISTSASDSVYNWIIP